jgi:hypothetical protein
VVAVGKRAVSLPCRCAEIGLTLESSVCVEDGLADEAVLRSTDALKHLGKNPIEPARHATSRSHAK